MWDGSSIPPVITSETPGTWAFDTVSRRLREDILARVFRDNADVLAAGTDAEVNLRALDAELSTTSTSVITHIPPDGGPDLGTWSTLCGTHLGKTWLEVPWLFAEFYFYRRILAAIGYFDPASPLHGHDPFATDKRAGLEAGMGAAASLAKKANAFAAKMASASNNDNGASIAETLRLFLMVSLWGNRMDLSIWPEDGGNEGGGASGGDRAANALSEALSSGEAYLLADDTNAVSAFLAQPGGKDTREVSIVVDNAGFELTCDLALADALITGSSAAVVYLRVKAHPVFVSDAMDADVRETVHAMTVSGDPALKAMGRRWGVYLSSGAWRIVPDFAWCQPTPFWSLPDPSGPFWALPDATCAELSRSDLVIVKGDANYRRLLNDAKWELDTPFEDVTRRFPAPLLALRTLKAELGCGIPREVSQRAAAEAPDDWMVSGTYGCAQYNPRPAAASSAASSALDSKRFAVGELSEVGLG